LKLCSHVVYELKLPALMAQLFGDDFSAEEDADFDVADLDDPEAYERYLGEDGVGDVDYDDDEAEAPVADTEHKRQARADLRKSAAEMEDELYQLDYEDIVAGLPCRFKYKPVEKESFGLTAEDILLAEDTELNKYVSLKKISAYVSNSGVNEAELSKKRKRLRENLKERLAREAEEAEKAGQQLKGTKPKAKPVDEDEEGGYCSLFVSLMDGGTHGDGAYCVDEGEADAGGDAEGKKRKRKRRKGANAAPQLITKDSAHAGESTLSARPAKSDQEPTPGSSKSNDMKRAGDSAGDKEKKKSKKSGKKKEESTQDKRMNLYR
jgi:protein KRI1